MLIAVIGGKLQGVEAAYLAKKAGWEVLVIDKDPCAPASGMCHRFEVFEFSRKTSFSPRFPKADLILPAVEDEEVLEAAEVWARTSSTPLAFDMNAFRLSSSKLKSDDLFRRMDLPAPKPWPDCGFPVLVKPDRASGSRGVAVFHDEKEISSTLGSRSRDDLVMQEYMPGPSYSIEVIGSPGNYRALQVTDLAMDETHDCKRVTAPTGLSPGQVEGFRRMGVAIAEEIRLEGIMDVEAVLNQGRLRLLEIDARLPSQTPMAVYWSTGINMVEMLGRLFLSRGAGMPWGKSADVNERCVILEHIRCSESCLEVLGEHIMGEARPLKVHPGFFGANEAISNYTPGTSDWVATLVFTGRSSDEVHAKKRACYQSICKHFKLNGVSDREPVV